MCSFQNHTKIMYVFSAQYVQSISIKRTHYVYKFTLSVVVCHIFKYDV